MKMFKNAATPLIAVAMMTVPMMAPAQSSQTGNATTTTTASTTGVEQTQSYKDGVESAQIDMAAQRVLDPQKSYRYTHPPVKKGADRATYLAGFSAGYMAQVKSASAPAGQ